jgi:hypothetical protein
MPTYLARIELLNLCFAGESRGVSLGKFILCSPPADAWKYEDKIGPNGKPWYSGSQNLNFPGSPYIDMEYESDDEHCRQRAAELSQPIVTLLRLFKEGRVHGRPFRVWNKLNPGELLSQMASDLSLLDLVETRNTYKLSDNDIAKLKEFYVTLSEVDQSPFLVAISRFNDSYTRKKDSDRFIDLLIALEALFGEGGDSVGYKIRLRCACFLYRFAGVQEDKQRIFQFLKRAYDERSNILHGRQKSLDWASEEKCLNLENIVRRSIIHMLLQAKAGNILTPDKIDQFLFLGEP